MRHQTPKINPYKKIADLHNKGIDFVFRRLQERELTAESVNFETILDIVSEYIAKIHNQDTPTNIAANYATLANFFNSSRDEIVDRILQDRGVPSDAIEYLDRIRQLDGELPPESLINELDFWEQKILTSNLKDEHSKYLLLYVAIAKGSIKDWHINASMRRLVVSTDRTWPWVEDSEVAVQAMIIGPIDIFVSGGTITAVSVIGGSIVSSCWTALKRRK